MSPAHLAWTIALLFFTGLGVVFRSRSGVAPRNILSEDWFIAAVCLITFVAGSAMLDAAEDAQAALEVDMTVSSGDIVDLYLNGNYAAPSRLPVVTKQRHTYRFEGLPQHIALMRLDPTNANGAHIALYSIRVKSGQRVLREFSPMELRAWNLSALKVASEDKVPLLMDSTTDDPMLSANLSVDFPSSIAARIGRFSGPDALFVLSMALFVLWVSARSFFRENWGEVATVAILVLTAYPVASAAMRLKGKLPPVSVAVGFASYTGYPKNHDYYAAFALFWLALLVPLAAWRLLPKHKPSALAPPASSRWLARVAHALVPCLLILYCQPNLAGGLEGLKNWQYRYAGWDDEHSLSWFYMMNSGLRPLRDFWFPYSGTYVMMLPFPIGPLALSLHQVALLSFLYFGLFFITEKKIGQTLALFLCVAIPILLGVLPGWMRYLLAADVAFLGIAVEEMRRWNWKRPLLFACITAYAFFFEPTQVFYAVAGIAVYVAIALFPRSPQKSWRVVAASITAKLRRTLLYTVAPILAGIVAAVAVFAVSGMLPGLWAFEKSLGDQAAYGGMNADIPGWVSPTLHNDSVFLFLFILIAYGVYRWLSMRGRPDLLGATLLAVCVVGFLAMQKQILRPHAMNQVRIFPFLALLLYGLLMWREHPRMARVLIGGFMGCMFAIASYQHFFQAAGRQIFAQALSNFGGNSDVLLHRAAEIRAINAERYSRRHFSAFEQQNTLVDILLRDFSLRPQDRVYVLGDESLFYVLLDQPAPVLSNTYNSSPVYEQENILRWMERQRPRFVIWPADVSSYDAVPHVVRLPLIYRYIVSHYTWVRTVDRYEILQEMTAGQVPDLAYWRHKLGETLDLAFVPSAANLSSYAECGSATCEDIVRIRYPASAAPRKVALEIGTKAGDFRVLFNVVPGEREYVIHLEQLWFWRLANAAASDVRIIDGEAELTIEHRAETRQVLY